MKKAYKRPPPRLAEQYGYLCRHSFEPLEISVMAKKAGYTEAQFISMFRRFYGTTPKGFVNVRRLGRAKLLLMLTSYPVCEIAARCGYSDEFYFYRLFRRRFGMTPTTYRSYMKNARKAKGDPECLS